jgi:uncharacterized membrane protein YtjA (UPF0391 family)
MLRAALFFFVLAMIAGLFGFTGLAGASAVVAKVLFFSFLAIWALLLVTGLFIVRSISGRGL